MSIEKPRVRVKAQSNNVAFFKIGDAEPILDKREFWGYFGSTYNGRFYEPPLPPKIVADLAKIAPHHQSPMLAKRDFAVRLFIPHKKLNRANFKELVWNYLIFGDAYAQKIPNMMDGLLEFKNSPALNTRKAKDDKFIYLIDGIKTHDLGEVCHIKNYDASQEIYGIPEYWSALQSMLLFESAIIFRRRYFINGSFAGFILTIGNSQLNDAQIDEIQEKLKGTKGKGNFGNILLNLPNSKGDDVKLIPIAEVGAKDIFPEIVGIASENMMVAHRAPPQIIGVVPKTAGGFGDVFRAIDGFVEGVIKPLCDEFLILNEFAGEEIVKFKDWVPLSGGTPSGNSSN